MSLHQNQLIRAFTRTRHMAQNQQEMYKIAQIKDHIRLRHEKAKKNHEKMQRKNGKNIQNKDQSPNMLKDINDHILQPQQLSQKYDVNINQGLSQKQVASKLQQFGYNVFSGGKQPNKVLLFISQMTDPFSLFMWLMIFLSLIAFGISDPRDVNPLFLSIIIFITIITGAIVSYQFIKDSQQIIKTFQQILPSFSNIRRNGVIQTVKAQNIVPGDILIIGPGQKISADIRLIEAHHLYFSKAIFSGENDEIMASVHCTNKQNALQSKNLIFSGYIAEKGNGIGIVIATGQNTLLSHLSNLVVNSEDKVTNIEVQISRYVKIMTIFAVTVGILVLIIGGLIGYDWLIAAMIAIGVTLASAPTVLNLVIVIMLTIAVKRLSKRQIICKNLNVIESLGSTSCMIVDKTGTITQSVMTVSNFSYDGELHFAKDLINNPSQRRQTFYDIQKCAILSSVANFNAAPPPDQISKINSRTDIQVQQKKRLQEQFCLNWKKKYNQLPIDSLPTIGDSTQSALIKYFQNIEQIEQTRRKYPIESEDGRDCFYAFDVLKKYSYCIVSEEDKNIIYIKGYPQIIWKMCRHIQMGDMIQQIKPIHEQSFKQHLKSFGRKGQRNICFAKKVIEKKCSSPRKKSLKIVQSLKKIDDDRALIDLTYLGMVSMQDPVKQGLEETILRVKAAGIKIVMVTGDYSQTAVSVARKVKIIQEPKTVNQIVEQYQLSFDEAFLLSQAIVISGDDLFKMQLQDQSLALSQKGRSLQKILNKRQVVFYKTNPSQKLTILEALKKMGHINCAIGDGVNDSPIVKFADAGVSMGSGADATKQAADIIFVDNDLNLIIFGIQEGRKIFQNLKKSICYVMTSQMSQWLPFVVLLVFRIPIPVFTLLIDGTADFVPAISYAYEDGQIGLMTRRPRNQRDHLVNYKLLAQCSGWMGFSSFLCSLTCYYICMNDFGFQPGSLWEKNNIPILLPQEEDVYNPTSPYYGNSNLAGIQSCQQFDNNTTGIDWINSLYPKADLRMSALTCHRSEKGITFKQNLVFTECVIQQISIITHKPVCYTTQAAKYGQTAYMYANVVNQIFNLFICKSSRMSLFTQRMDNYIIYMGISFELLLALALNETLFMVQLIGTRDTIFMHYGLAAIPFGIVQLILDEIRKYLIRNLPPKELEDPLKRKQAIPNWFERYLLW